LDPFFQISGIFMTDDTAETDISRFVPVAGAPHGAATGADRAVVVFAEQTALPWLRILKPGFRHCGAYLRLPQGWIGVDPLSHWLVLRAFPDWPRDADLAAHLRRDGQCALTVAVAEPARRLAPPLPFTCVETVKRLIGLQSWMIRTPWELYRHVRNICLDYDPHLFYNSTPSEHLRDAASPAGRRAGTAPPRAREKERKAAMGGLFGSSPPPPPPLPPPPPPPEAEQPSDADLAAEAARERRRRAQADTIATSWRGLGSDAGGAVAPKRLIGD
jgi:hypothetical protein